VKISSEKLLAEAEATGFRPEILEKVIHLLNLLEGLQSHPFLKGKLALKGGTALNLFMFDLPRLSVDIDLNYVVSPEPEIMLMERPKIDEALIAVCAREGLTVRRVQDDHAAVKYSLRYESSVGRGGNLEVDVNYMFRVPLWPIVTQDSRAIGSYIARAIPVLDIHELAAGKLAALLARRQPRDFFDVHQLLTRANLDRERLRLTFVVYGALNRRDWRKVSLNDVGSELRDMSNSLAPLLRRDILECLQQSGSWGSTLVTECRQAMEILLPLSETEMEFLNCLLDRGEIKPHLLTSDAQLAERIKGHPALEWKALNVRQHKKK
jgi:hypothetical protein